MKLILLAIILSVSSFAADLSGSWTGSATMERNGDTRNIPVKMSLKQTGDGVLEGTVEADNDGKVTPITTGRLNGSVVTLEVKLNSDEGPIVVKIRLESSGDQLKGTYSRESRSTITGSLTFNRQK